MRVKNEGVELGKLRYGRRENVVPLAISGPCKCGHFMSEHSRKTGKCLNCSCQEFTPKRQRDRD